MPLSFAHITLQSDRLVKTPRTFLNSFQMAISQFFVFSPRGDVIISRDFRGDVPRGSADILFRHLKNHPHSPPVFALNDVFFAFISRNGLILAATSLSFPSPAWAVELLARLARVFKDFSGQLTEESVRKNFGMFYEILDEAVCFGLAQTTAVERMRLCIRSEAASDAPPSLLVRPLGLVGLSAAPKTLPSSAVSRPLAASTEESRNEIFVDLIEKISVTMDADGRVVRQALRGSLQLKSYLSGNPELRIGLNEDLAIEGEGASGSVVISDCNIHEAADLTEFETQRVIRLFAPEGEFTLMNYRLASSFAPPVRLVHSVEVHSQTRVDLVLRLRVELPASVALTNLTVAVPVGCAVVSIGTELWPAGQTAELSGHQIIWKAKKIPGGQEMGMRAKLNLSSSSQLRLGAVSANFEISMFNPSNMQVKFLRINDRGNPARWVRYLTQTSSYVFRLYLVFFLSF